MIVCDGLERKNHWYTFLFGFACLAGSAYGFLQGAWPFGLAEGFWACLKFWQFYLYYRDRPKLVDQNK